ncbi:MAG: hypothetical protein HQL75_05990 [Magnetococcales bacterium]|nr:hypothetical protein [Magnetococcales bacterium]
MPEPSTLFAEHAAEKVAALFGKITIGIAKRCRWDLNQISISEHALQGALSESAKDVQAIINRRNHNEISPGKLAGILTFRISRWGPIQLSGELKEDPRAMKLNAAVPFALCLKHFLGVNITNFPSAITEEFHYTLLRRHTNQETLGLAYDMLEFHVSNMRVYNPAQE